MKVGAVPLKSAFGAEGGDFAVAYVLAHEYGHHIQTLLGTSDKMRQAQRGKSEAEANRLSVALELQADFYAGLWTHYNQEQNAILEPGDIKEALSAGNAVGDYAIQKKMQGDVVPGNSHFDTTEGDIEEALSAAHAVGDDAIQSKMQGHVVPDSFTHGTSEQRMYWFNRGFKSGDIRKGDTFSELF